MNANGPSTYPGDEDEASSAHQAKTESGQAKKDERVSTTVTEENEHGKTVEAAVKTQSDTGPPDGGGRNRIGGGVVPPGQPQPEALMVFLSECWNELKKIHWPDRQQVIRETMSVIVLVTIITACVLAFDYGIAKAVFEPLDKLARSMGGGIGVHH